MLKTRTVTLLLPFALYCSAASAKLVIAVKTITATPTTISQNITSVGNVESREITYIQTIIAGRITQMIAQVGDPVTENQVVAVMNPDISKDTLREAQAQYNAYKVAYAAVQKDVATAKQLVAAQAMTSDDLQKIELKLQSVKAKYTASKADLDKAKFGLQSNKIRSKVNGIIQEAKVTVGSVVPAGEPIYLVANTQYLKAVLPFPQNLRNHIKVGQRIELQSAASTNTIDATVSSITPVINPVNRSFDVIANFNNNSNTWYPGASVIGTLYRHQKITGFVVPEISIVSKADGEYVYTVVDQHAQLKKVTTHGYKDSDHVIITSGIQPNDKVVTYGAQFLIPNMPVKEAKN